MTDSLKIYLAQRNPTVGDITGNIALIRESRAAAAEAGADLVVFSELVVCGYPPEDLVLKPFFQDKVEAAVYELARDTADGNPGKRYIRVALVALKDETHAALTTIRRALYD